MELRLSALAPSAFAFWALSLRHSEDYSGVSINSESLPDLLKSFILAHNPSYS